MFFEWFFLFFVLDLAFVYIPGCTCELDLYPCTCDLTSMFMRLLHVPLSATGTHEARLVPVYM